MRIIQQLPGVEDITYSTDNMEIKGVEGNDVNKM